MVHALPGTFKSRVAAYTTEPISASRARKNIPSWTKFMRSRSIAARVLRFPELAEAARNAHYHTCPGMIPAHRTAEAAGSVRFELREMGYLKWSDQLRISCRLPSLAV